MDARNSKVDDQLLQQFDKLVSDGKNLNEPQQIDSLQSDYPITLAADGCAEKALEYILSHGADTKSISKTEGMSALNIVAIGAGCSENRVARMAELLLSHGADVSSRASNGATPIFEAIMNHHSKMVQVLLEHGADVNSADSNGMTPLQLAAWNGRKEIAELLINHGADINARDPNGNTAMAWCQRGETAPNAQTDGHDVKGTIKLLQDHGAQ